MSTSRTASGEPDPVPEPGVGAGIEPASTQLDDAVVRDLELAQPAVDLARSATEALNIANDSFIQASRDVHQDLAHIGQAVTNDMAGRITHDVQQHQRELAEQADIAAASATSATPDPVAAWRRFQEQNAERARQAMDSIRSLADGIGPWIKKAAKATGEKIAEFYRNAAPPNWTTDPTAAVSDYGRAVRLALDEGIPLAWVPDQDTVALLLAVPGSGAVRRTRLLAILEARHEGILDYCRQRLDQIALGSTASPDQQDMVEFTCQAVQALRLGLTGPAQSMAANLIDQLLRRAFTTIHGDYRHTSVRPRLESLAQRTATGLMFLGTLREVATMMPVFQAMTPWWPDSGKPPPTGFSRHVTAHRPTASGQVARVHALIAVMLAVSLLSQEHDSGWRSWRMLRGIDEQAAALLNNHQDDS